MRILVALPDDEDEGCSCCEPHPELAAAVRPSPVQVAEAAGMLGVFPDVPYLGGGHA